VERKGAEWQQAIMLIAKCASLRSMEIHTTYTIRLSMEGVRHDDVWNGFWAVNICRVDRYYCRPVDPISE